MDSCVNQGTTCIGTEIEALCISIAFIPELGARRCRPIPQENIYICNLQRCINDSDGQKKQSKNEISYYHTRNCHILHLTQIYNCNKIALRHYEILME